MAELEAVRVLLFDPQSHARDLLKGAAHGPCTLGVQVAVGTAKIERLNPAGPAALCGTLLPGDVIERVDGQRVDPAGTLNPKP